MPLTISTNAATGLTLFAKISRFDGFYLDASGVFTATPTAPNYALAESTVVAGLYTTTVATFPESTWLPGIYTASCYLSTAPSTSFITYSYQRYPSAATPGGFDLPPGLAAWLPAGGSTPLLVPFGLYPPGFFPPGFFPGFGVGVTGGPLIPGAIQPVGIGPLAIVVVGTAPAGGVLPVEYTWYRAAGIGTPYNLIAGEHGPSLVDYNAVSGVVYRYYRVTRDTAGSTVSSSTTTATIASSGSVSSQSVSRQLTRL